MNTSDTIAIDQSVARHIMDWYRGDCDVLHRYDGTHVCRSSGTWYDAEGNFRAFVRPIERARAWSPCTSWADAGQVMDQLRALGWVVKTKTWPEGPAWAYVGRPEDEPAVWERCDTESVRIAICIAALKAYGIVIAMSSTPTS